MYSQLSKYMGHEVSVDIKKMTYHTTPTVISQDNTTICEPKLHEEQVPIT